MSQQYTWGSQSQPDPHRSSRRVPPISTTVNSFKQSNTSTDSPSRSPFPSTSSAFPSLPPTRQPLSRTSSASSINSPFSPSQAGSQQPHHGSLLSSTRLRNISSSTSHLASSAAAVSHASHGGGGTGSGGGGRFGARASPALSQSGTLPSPSSTNNSSSSQSGQSLTKITIAQVFLLLSRLPDKEKDRAKWEVQAAQLRKLINSGGMEPFVKAFRRMVKENAPRIGLPGANRSAENTNSYDYMVQDMQHITEDPNTAPWIAESIDTTEGDVFRDFDLSTFMDHFRLSPAAKTTLALAFKSKSKSDLRTKADAILSSIYPSFINTLQSPGAQAPDDLTPAFLGSLIERLIQTPPRTWTEDSRADLVSAVTVRYQKQGTVVPSEVASALYLMELLGPENPLVRKIQKAGPKAVATVDAAKDLLASVEVREVDYTQITSALLFLAIAYNTQPRSASNFVAALREHRAGRQLDWQDVVISFDREKLRITKQQFLSLFRAFSTLAKDYENFDLQCMWGGNWKNSETQLSFVVAFLSCSPDEIDADSIPRLRKAFTRETFEDASDEVRAFVETAVHHPLVSLDAVTILFGMVFQTQQSYTLAQKLGIPEAVINANTEIFVVSASAVPKPWKELQYKALKQLFEPFWTKNLAQYDFVLHGLWKHDPNFVADAALEHYRQNALTLVLTLEHAANHGWIEGILQRYDELSLDLAALVHSRGVYNIDAWIQHMFATLQDAFARILFNYLSAKCELELVTQREKLPPSQVPLSVKTVLYLLDAIEQGLPEDQVLNLQRSCLQAYPRLINYGEGFDAIIDSNANPDLGNAISSEVDQKMQEHYRKMYAREQDVRDVVDALRRYKTSNDANEQELFVCMVHGLFDEYNCFETYPLDALATTAVLFGSIINYRLLSKVAMQCGLAMVLEALTESEPDGPMYKFGLQALLQFKDRLSEWPKYCERLLRVPQLQGTEIYTVAQDVAGNTGSDLNGDLTNGLSLPNGSNVEDFLNADPVAPTFQCLHADPPINPELYEDPDEEVSDKVLFVLNNVSERNLTDKLKDLQDVLDEKHHQWFANYLVEERAKMQPNFQKLYLEMLELFDDRTLWAEVVRETFVSVIRMLNSESTLTNSTEKGHLKNLGGWLGSLTLARDLSIKHRNISFKDLLIEGHHSQRHVIVIPFTCKVLLKAAESTIFRPPNPWLMDIVSLLIELYHYADLKLNLKFEIEVLCKDLSLDHKTIEPSTSIRSRPVVEDYDVSNMLPDPLDGFNDLSLMGLHRPGRANGRFSPTAIAATLPDLRELLNYPPGQGNANTARMNSILFQAAQQAVTEIIAPVVERSVTIASISAAQIIQKDFSMEPDEENMRRSAHSMVKALSGALGLVTCKEPLRMSIMNNIRMIARDTPEQTLPEGIIMMFVNDNLDLVCSSIEQAAEAKSASEVDLHLEEAFRARRAWRQSGNSEPYKDPALSHWAFYVPEPYKQTPGGLNTDQLAIYEEFGRQVRPTAAHGSNAIQDGTRQVPDVLQDQFPAASLLTPAEAPAVPRQGIQQPPRMQSIPPLQTAPQHLNGYVDLEAASDRLQALLEELQRLAREAPETRVSELTKASPLHQVFDQINNLLNSAASAIDQLCLFAANKIASVLFADTTGRLEVEVLVGLLANLCDKSVQTAKQVLFYLNNMDDERNLNAWLTADMIREQLTDVVRVDDFVAKALNARRETFLDFLYKLLDELVLTVPLDTLRSSFALSLDALNVWALDDPSMPEVQQLLSKLQTSDSPTAVSSDDPSAQAEYVFAEWLELQRPDVPNKIIATFLHQLHRSQILQNSDSASTFVSSCMDISIGGYELEEQSAQGNLDNAYLRVDGLANLLVLLVVHQGGDDGAVQQHKVQYLDGLLSTVVLLLSKYHQARGEAFSQKVFFRLFSTLIHGVHKHASALADYEREIFQVIGKALLAMQPRFFPGFSFNWLGLVAHRLFMPAMIKSGDEVSWSIYVRLIEAVLGYTGQLVRDTEATLQCRTFYQAVLRILLVIHHDYPEFLAENHFRLGNAVSVQCLQLRNLIVSAYPSSFPELPDPFTAGLKVDRMEEIRKPPTLREDIEAYLENVESKGAVDRLINGSDPDRADVEKICDSVYVAAPQEAGHDFASVQVDVPLINATVIYIASAALAAQGPKVPAFNPQSPATKIFETLAMELRPEARYHLISAMANQLRWPNSHTHYFSCMIVHLIGTSSTAQKVLDVQQTAIRVLLERLLVHRPHPWGLIITLLEVINGHGDVFWNLPFVKSNPEVPRLFEAMLQQLQRSPRALT